MATTTTVKNSTHTMGVAPASAITVEPGQEIPLWRELFSGVDWLALRLSPIYFGLGVRRGDGSPVVVVPGLFGTDDYLVELHSWLRRIGYAAYFSDIGLNADCPKLLTERLLKTVEKAFRETGRPVRLIGHSLGGLLARAAALRRPDLIVQVITLGSPVNGVRAHPLVVAAVQHVGSSCTQACVDDLQAPLPEDVAEVSIFTKTDGVVDWRTCIRGDGRPALEVAGTHAGLVFNPQVYRAISQLLALPRSKEADPRLRIPRYRTATDLRRTTAP